jgi:hypothetical protein
MSPKAGHTQRKPAACNKFLANNFLLINTHKKEHWLSFNHKKEDYLLWYYSINLETTDFNTASFFIAKLSYHMSHAQDLNHQYDSLKDCLLQEK